MQLAVGDVEVLVEGEGDAALLMVHGWPDTHRLWQPQVDHLLAAFPGELRCVRFTLPGYDAAGPAQPRSFQQLADTVAAVALRVSPERPVSLLLHDWGCVFGYRFAAQHPDRVARIVGIDVGDHNAPALFRSLSVPAKLMVAAYQLWLALAWQVGRHASSAAANGMTRAMARLAGSRVPAERIGWQMNYPYALQWSGMVRGLSRGPAVAPACPMLYCWGRRKPFQFQSPEWLRCLAARPGCEVQPFETGHWPMLEQPDLFNETLVRWLRRTPA